MSWRGAAIFGIALAAACARPPGSDATGQDGVTLPALVDHHVHLLNVGLWLLNDAEGGRLFLDLSAASLDEIVRQIAARAASLPEGAWIAGAGWSQAAWGTQALPTHELLSRAAPSHPVFLARTDGHAGWVNRRAMELAGITSAGVLLERDNEPVTRLIPGPSDGEIVRAFRLATEALAARGVAEVYDAGFLAFPGVAALNTDLGRHLRLLRLADSLEPLPVQVNLMIPAPSPLAESLLVSTRRWTLSPRIRISHLKLFGDGALGSRGAALTHPYADDPGTASVPRMTTAEILDWGRRALTAGLGVATHAIGDEAVRRTLDAYETLRGEAGDAAPGALRIEHFSYAREEDFARAARLGVRLSIQSNFNSGPDDAPTFGAMRVGEANEPRVYAWRRLYDLGADLAEGTDWFARPRGALEGFHAAMTRRHAVGLGHDDPDTRAAVYRLHASTRSGDSATWSGDPVTAPLDSLLALRARRTVSAGRVTWQESPR